MPELKLTPEIQNILNALIDSFEGGQRKRRPFFYFQPDSSPQYFTETTSTYRLQINSFMKHLEVNNVIEIFWLKHQKDNIIEKIALNLNEESYLYDLLNRIPQNNKTADLLKLLDSYPVTGWLNDFYIYLQHRLTANKSVKQYINLDNLKEAEDILKTLKAISNLKEGSELPKRVFSAQVLTDSKRFNQIETKIVRILRDFNPNIDNLMLDNQVLATLGLVQNIEHILLSGPLTISYKNREIDLSAFSPDVGIPAKMLSESNLYGQYSKVITIENLTSYYEFLQIKPEDTLAIYLGGYHNQLRRDILLNLNSTNPTYYHWGDIDFGGFSIFIHLKESTRLNIYPWQMDLLTLKQHEKFSIKGLTPSYRKKLTSLLLDHRFTVFADVIAYMLDKDIRLEQENIRAQAMA